MLDRIRQELAATGRARVRVKVTPKSGRSEISGFLADGTMKARLLAAPERGKANEELCALLARKLGLRPNQVTISSGAASPLKTLLVRS
jgi:uncharacterized protein YggU (UPF0235/DUF167 family)